MVVGVGIGVVLTIERRASTGIPADALVVPADADEMVALVGRQRVVMLAGIGVVEAIDRFTIGRRDPANILVVPTDVDEIGALVLARGVKMLTAIGIVKAVHDDGRADGVRGLRVARISGRSRHDLERGRQRTRVGPDTGNLDRGGPLVDVVAVGNLVIPVLGEQAVIVFDARLGRDLGAGVLVFGLGQRDRGDLVAQAKEAHLVAHGIGNARDGNLVEVVFATADANGKALGTKDDATLLSIVVFVDVKVAIGAALREVPGLHVGVARDRDLHPRCIKIGSRGK